MKSKLFFLLGILLFGMMSVFNVAFCESDLDYRLGPGDVLEIGVWGFDEFKPQTITVRPDGKFAFPLVGEIRATGTTAAELTTLLTQSLSEYLKNPQVTVNIIKFRTVRVYVLGEVNKPGMYEIEKQHNLLDAISLAGGHTKYAIKKKVYIVHKASGQYQEANYYRLLTKGDLSQNLPLGDGDVVYLAGNHINFVADILPFITATYQIRDILND